MTVLFGNTYLAVLFSTFLWEHLLDSYLVTWYHKIKLIPSPEQTDRRALIASLRILAMVHGENFKGGSKTARLVYEEFYIPEIAEKIDIRNDYLNWMNNKLRPAVRTGVSELCPLFVHLHFVCIYLYVFYVYCVVC